ncbi:MAG: flagellar motor switch protein FliN [Aestuariibacter sp.]
MSDDDLDDWAAAMAEQAESEGEEGDGGESVSGDAALGMSDVQVAELDELSDETTEIGAEEKRKLDTILDIPVTISMEVGRSLISIRNLLQLNQGSVVELDRVAGEPLDVLVNGTLIAHGEVVVVNDKFGIRLTDVISQIERIKKLK